MYSPAARPSMQRAAPAKNRRLSTRTGTSSRIAAIGLPTFSDSTRLSSSAPASSASAIRRSASARSPGGVPDQPSNAPAAAATAASTSAASDSGARAMTSPVAGSRISSVAPARGAAGAPPMKLSIVVATVLIGRALLLVSRRRPRPRRRDG
jgi:hypothetical protein